MRTLNNLDSWADMRCTMELEMDHGAYERHYQSNKFPRFRLIAYQNQNQERWVKLMVDFIECKDLQAVASALWRSPSDLLQ